MRRRSAAWSVAAALACAAAGCRSQETTAPPATTPETVSPVDTRPTRPDTHKPTRGIADVAEVADSGTRSVHTLRVVTRTRGYRHTSIPDGLAALQALGAARGWTVTAHPDDAPLAPAPGELVVLLSTTGDFLTDAELSALDAFVRAGGGLLAIHAATDAEYASPQYRALLGAWFARHPAIQAATIAVVAPDHPAVAGLTPTLERTDEWYDFDARPESTVLVTVDEDSYSGAEMGEPHPVAGAHAWGAGRVFTTAMGHTSESYAEPWVRAHLDAALGWLAAR